MTPRLRIARQRFTQPRDAGATRASAPDRDRFVLGLACHTRLATVPISRLLVVALAGEGLLAGVALAWIRLRGLGVGAGTLVTGLWMGLGAALLLGFVNYAVLRLAPPIQPVRAVRRLYHEKLRPLFAEVGPLEIVGISLAAGVGEELLFRGAVQAEFGLMAASVLFGLAHIGDRSSVVFGLWVAVMGFGLGGLAYAAGGLLAPIVAHAVYDAAAISYIRWAPKGA